MTPKMTPLQELGVLLAAGFIAIEFASMIIRCINDCCMHQQHVAFINYRCIHDCCMHDCCINNCYYNKEVNIKVFFHTALSQDILNS